MKIGQGLLPLEKKLRGDLKEAYKSKTCSNREAVPLAGSLQPGGTALTFELKIYGAVRRFLLNIETLLSEAYRHW